MNPNYYNTRQVAAMLGMGVDWVWQQVRDGKMPHHRVGGRIRFTAQDLAEYEEQTSVDPDGTYNK